MHLLYVRVFCVVSFARLQDQLEAICVRVRWEDLKAGLAEESEHYTTLEPFPEEGSGSVLGSSAGHWFVTARFVSYSYY